MDKQTEEAVEELRRKLQRLYPLIAARTPKYFYVPRLLRRSVLRWSPEQGVILVRCGPNNETQPLHSLPASDLLYAVRALPAYVNELLFEERELARSATTSLENLDKLLKHLEQP